MKIKMTIIAFFVSVLMLSSCMKNEVSPGIEEIRSAYASLIYAKAESEQLIGQADALFREAQADSLNAENVYDQARYALQLDSLAALFQQQIDSMNREIQGEKDLAVKTYYANYIGAIADYAEKLDTISGTMKAVAQLQSDLDNGETRALDAAQADLESAEAALAALQAEIVIATASLGDPDAVEARILELRNDSLSAEANIVLNEALISELESVNPEDNEPSEDTYLANICDEVQTAQTEYDEALENFLEGINNDDKIPSFWKLAIDSVDSTEARLARAFKDTVDSYDKWKAVYDLIELGESEVDAAIEALDEEIELATDTLNNGEDRLALDALIADTLEAYLYDSTTNADLESAKDDIVTYEEELQEAKDTLDERRALHDTNPSGELTALIDRAVLDSASLELDIQITQDDIDGVLTTDTATSQLAYDGVMLDYNTNSGDFIEALGDIADRILVYQGARDYQDETERVNVLSAIAQAELDIIDLRSDYLHHQTFIDNFIDEYDLAVEYKESVREDYEQWMDEYWEEHLEGLANALAEAKEICASYVGTYADAYEAWELAMEAYKESQQLIYNLEAENTALGDAILNINKIIDAYLDAKSFNDEVLERFDGLLADAEGNVGEALKAIEDAQLTYSNGEIDLDTYVAKLAQQRAELDAIQARIDHWKALLDEAIANAS